MEGFYFLTKERDLKFARVVDSASVVRLWRIGSDAKPSDFWRIAIESRALGLSEEETRSNLATWGLNDENGLRFCHGGGIAAEKMDGGWLVAVARKRKESEAPGPPVSKFEVGTTLVEALAELAKPGLLVSG